MKKVKKDIPSLIGLITTTALAVISGGLINPATTSILGSSLSNVGSGIGASLAASFLTNFTPVKIKKWFVNVHPNDLNHNVKKLFFESVQEALNNIFVLFSETQVSDSEKKHVKQLIKTLQKHLPEMLSNSTQIQIEESEIKHFFYGNDGEDVLFSFIENQFADFGITEPFKSFLAKNLPAQIQLCFGEGLKDPANQNAWIAFQRMLIEEIRSDIKQIANTQQNIKDDLSDLKFEKSGFSQEQIAEIRELIKILNNKKLVEVKIKNSINQSLKSIENKANEIIRITTKTQLSVDELKIIIEKIKRQNRTNHIILFIFVICLLASGTIVIYKLIHQPFTATIRIVDWKGKDNPFINESGSKVRIWLGGEPREYKSISDGYVEFSKIPAKYKNEAVQIDFQPSEEYPLYIKDKTISLQTEEKMELKVYVKGLDSIRGNIKDCDTEKIIEGALIKINGQSTYSDSLGNFEMSFQPDKQEINQTIEIYKNNYQRYFNTFDMRTNIYNPVPFRLQRSKNTTK
jgi:hypothetical protein